MFASCLCAVWDILILLSVYNIGRFSSSPVAVDEGSYFFGLTITTLAHFFLYISSYCGGKATGERKIVPGESLQRISSYNCKQPVEEKKKR